MKVIIRTKNGDIKHIVMNVISFNVVDPRQFNIPDKDVVLCHILGLPFFFKFANKKIYKDFCNALISNATVFEATEDEITLWTPPMYPLGDPGMITTAKGIDEKVLENIKNFLDKLSNKN